MIAPFVQVQVSVSDLGQQFQQSCRVSAVETLADLIAQILREFHLAGERSYWQFKLNERLLDSSNTVGEAWSYAGEPRVLVLTLVRKSEKREQAGEAGDDWGVDEDEDWDVESSDAPPRAAQPSPAKSAPRGSFAVPAAPPAPASVRSPSVPSGCSN